jgi:hypothetical protein
MAAESREILQISYRSPHLRGPRRLCARAAPLVCTVYNGWSARIVHERTCMSTSLPLNTLTVIGVPNSVLSVWYGAFDAHPPGFEFVETPMKTDEDILGDRHSGPATGQQPPS